MRFSAQKIEWELISMGYEGVSVYVSSETGSTNNDAKDMAAFEEGDYIVAADMQSAGKGTHNRQFFSPGETGFYLSVAMKDIPMDAPVVFAAAVAVNTALETSFGIETDIKWINDIYKNGKKAGGILCERAGDGTTVVGIGLNLMEPDGGFPEEIRDKATSLGLSPAVKDTLVCRIYANLFELLRERPDDIFPIYKSKCFLIGRRVRCVFRDSEEEALVTGLGEKGELIVVNSELESRVISSGEVMVFPL